MKRCPSCQRTYTDETLRFCLEDGSILISGAASSSSASSPSDPLAATLLDSPPRNTASDRAARTEVLHSPSTSDNQASPTHLWGAPNISQPAAAADSWGARRHPGQQSSAPFASSPSVVEKKRSWPAITSLLIGIMTWLTMLLSFVGAGIKLPDEFIGLSFLSGIFLSVFGIVFGAVAFGIALKNPDRYSGKGIALIGFFMNLLPTLFLLMLVAIGIAVLQ
jgi:hypothetical protein